MIREVLMNVGWFDPSFQRRLGCMCICRWREVSLAQDWWAWIHERQRSLEGYHGIKVEVNHMVFKIVEFDSSHQGSMITFLLGKFDSYWRAWARLTASGNSCLPAIVLPTSWQFLPFLVTRPKATWVMSSSVVAHFFANSFQLFEVTDCSLPTT